MVLKKLFILLSLMAVLSLLLSLWLFDKVKCLFADDGGFHFFSHAKYPLNAQAGFNPLASSIN